MKAFGYYRLPFIVWPAGQLHNAAGITIVPIVTGIQPSAKQNVQ
jgi:hypothetical protein